MKKSSDIKRASCARCAHYYITFDARFPYGCRIMGFKSQRLPAHEILAATGAACVAFESRPPVQRESL